MRDTYYGNKISQYGLEHGYVDYACLAKAFDAVLCNRIIEADPELFCNLQSGSCVSYINNDTGIKLTYNEYNELDIDEQDNYYEYTPEVYQWFIVSESGANILTDADELVYYSELLGCYVWGVTHYGTSWEYVLTNIKIEDD